MKKKEHKLPHVLITLISRIRGEIWLQSKMVFQCITLTIHPQHPLPNFNEFIQQ